MAGEQDYRRRCAGAVEQALAALRPAIECQVNAEFWAGWRAGLERAVTVAEQWRDENKTSAGKARKSLSVGCQNMAEMLDGAALECSAIAQELRRIIAETALPAPTGAACHGVDPEPAEVVG